MYTFRINYFNRKLIESQDMVKKYCYNELNFLISLILFISLNTMILTCNDDRDDPQVIFFLCWKLRKLLSPWLLNYECAFYTYIGFADFEFFQQIRQGFREGADKYELKRNKN